MLIDIYDYWFNRNSKNLQRHWISVTTKDKSIKLQEIEQKFLQIYFRTIFKILINYRGSVTRDRTTLISGQSNHQRLHKGATGIEGHPDWNKRPPMVLGKDPMRVLRGDFRTTDVPESVNFKNSYIQEYSQLSIRERISIIILLDQFTRNLGHKYKNINKWKQICTNLAYTLAHKDFIENKNFLFLNPNELLFVLMVYKHMNYSYFPLIYDIVNDFCRFNNVKLTDNSCNYLLNFYTDFYKKYINSVFPTKEFMNITSSSSSFKVTNITEIYKICNVSGYLPLTFIEQIYDFSIIDDLDKMLFNILNNKINGDICVSLSGGVDSMVIIYILKKLERQLNIKLNTFHISYNNRTESNDETKLIWTFCNKLNIPLYHYNIDYLKRGDINRDKYEQITRDIRFKCYKIINCPIILGHIYEDKIENIFTNLSTNKHLFNLSKIELFSCIDNVQIIRPFVNIKKEIIYEYAHAHKIPYLNDTTPEWSNRGKFRNEFIKSYTKQYEKTGIENLVKLSDTLQNYGKLIQETVIQPKIKDLVNLKSVELPDSILENCHLVREIFTGCTHHFQYSMPSEKSINGLINVLVTKKNKKYQLTKNILLEVGINRIKIVSLS